MKLYVYAAGLKVTAWLHRDRLARLKIRFTNRTAPGVMMAETDDERQIRALHEAGDRALMSADLDTLSRIFADDYVQHNDSGQSFTKQDVLEKLRTGAIRYPSIISTGRSIRVMGDVAVVNGAESDVVESGGKQFEVQYVYLDVLLKRNGKWKLVASQLAIEKD